MNRNRNDMRISCFVAHVSPVIVGCVRAVLASHGLEVKEEGSGLDLALRIETPSGEVKFLLHNLLLEIATVDRDENPLRFDKRVLNRDFLTTKATAAIESKLRVLSCLLRKENLEEAVRDIEALAKDYERLRIWRIDRNPADSREVPRPGEQTNERGEHDDARS